MSRCGARRTSLSNSTYYQYLKREYLNLVGTTNNKRARFFGGLFYYSGVAPPHLTSFLRVSFSELPRESRNISLYHSMRQIIWLIVITGLVPVILVQQEPKQVNKLALLLHKYRFRQDCRNTSGNDSKRRWFNTCCLLFKYHSPEANASTSPAGGEVVNC